MTLLDCLTQVQDTRRLQGQRFPLSVLLLMIIMSKTKMQRPTWLYSGILFMIS
jgi:hypothetical protein